MRTLTAVAITALFSALSRGRLPYDEEEEEVNLRAVGGWVVDSLTDDVVSSIPLAGKELMDLWDEFRGKRRYPRYSAFGAPVEKVLRVAKLFGKWRNEGELSEEDYRRGIWYTMEAAGLSVVPLPSTAIRRVWQAFITFDDEESIAESIKVILGMRGGS
jgi:hypothetical protein